ncbi:Serpentine receptor class r-10 [Caenorhabditis elegans]|uniref:Serpentine receptor class r-10 n=1 Tax=Caenorhabditis elegans TaxID=6239 RepID=O18115_CAEEL|nr:Seven TM Receptor [Caenorhabditis elegans]CAA90675.1 Seven TM Receptor [Caenorhabditis elegans]|eukprot:NP_510135.1 Seven TM Receptor [Caenorhabditis elegans]
MDKLIVSLQYSGFLGSIVLNALLLHLLFHKASSSFGRYKILMISFSIFAIFYSIVDVLTLPVIFAKGRSICVCSNGPLKLFRSIGVPLTAVYCGSFGLCISLLALHFFYRYIAVCKPEKMYYFDEKHICYTFVLSIFIFVAWTITTYFPMLPDEMREEYYSDVLMDNFLTDSHETSFLVMMYKTPPDRPEPVEWIYSQLLACGFMCFQMSTCSFVMLFCGYKAVVQMKHSEVHMSSKTRNLSRQLMMTLGAQTLLPFTTVFLPVGLIIVLPVFGIDVGVAANKTAAFLGIYPALDPMIAIFLIKDFRYFVFCRSESSYVSSALSLTSHPSKVFKIVKRNNAA